MDSMRTQISNFTTTYKELLAKQLSKVEKLVEDFILSKCVNEKEIGQLFDILLSMLYAGIETNSFEKLLDYYKTFNPDNSFYYWKQYDHFSTQ